MASGLRYSLKRHIDPKKMTKLPRECTLTVPEWPDSFQAPLVLEIDLWTNLWKRPQAHVWHLERTYESVALYVRLMIEAARPRASSQTRIAVRQMADILLINSPALSSQGYVITDESEAAVMGEEGFHLAATGTDGAPAVPANRTGKSSRSRMGARVVPIRDDAQ